jgi:HD superfamily phosphohydrolase YqeK
MKVLSEKSKKQVFEKTLALIKNNETRKWVKETLDIFPEYFWTQPASSTGKYHPACALSTSGLLIHTKRVVWFALKFISAFGNEINDETRDNVIAACILHDGCKGGKGKGSYEDYVNHPILVEKYYKGYAGDKLEPWQQEIFTLIRYHMGPWTPESVKKPLEKYTKLEFIVYLADFLASRKDLNTNVDSFGNIQLEYEEV